MPTATAAKPKASTYSVKMELRDGKPIYTIPKRHWQAFHEARERAEQYAGLTMPGLTDEAKAAADAIGKLLERFA